MLIIASLLLVLWLVSAYLILKYPGISRVQKIILISIRTSLFTLLIVSFIEPTCTFTKLSKTENTIAVVVDKSKSMQLFNSDSVVQSIQKKLQSSSVTQKKYSNKSIVWYGFGDSLIRIPSNSRIHFSDKQSYFPLQLSGAIKAKSIILLSDGNLSNPLSDLSGLTDKQLYYIPLTQTKRFPFITVDMSTLKAQYQCSSTVRTSLFLRGFCEQPTKYTFTAKDNDTLLKQLFFSLDTGYFDKEIPLSLVTARTGLHRLSFRIQSNKDSIGYAWQRSYHVLSSKSRVYFYSNEESLDKRFLSLSLMSNTSWHLLDSCTPDAAPVCILFFSWDQKAKELLNTYHDACAAFIDCLPCWQQSPATEVCDNFSVEPGKFTSFGSIDYASLPPIHFRQCQSPLLFNQGTVLLKGTFLDTNTDSTTTHPLIFFLEDGTRRHLCVALKDFWQWDMWLKLSGPDARPYQFTSSISDLLLKMVKENLNNTFALIPRNETFHAYDSCRFSVFFPSYLVQKAHAQLTTSLFSLPSLIPRLSSVDSVDLSSTQQYTALKPVHEGVYILSSELVYHNTSLVFRDTLVVRPYEAEHAVYQQNRLLLESIAKPLSLDDSLTVSSLFSTKSNTFVPAQTEQRILSIHKSWILLASIIIAFTLEWALRRKWALD